MPRGWLSSNKLNRKIYDTWYDMIKRCYSDKYHQREPSYIGCTVNIRWKYLSNFVKDISNIPGYSIWSQSFNQHMALDKDILVPGNREYGPGLVCFVDMKTNSEEEIKRNRWYPIEVRLLDGTLVGVFYNGLDEVAKVVGRSKQTVNDVIRGRQKSTNGYLIKRL